MPEPQKKGQKTVPKSKEWKEGYCASSKRRTKEFKHGRRKTKNWTTTTKLQ
jgi:hypothetical protein